MHTMCPHAPSVDSLVNIFNTTFLSSCNTCLVPGGLEPEYIPANTIAQPHHIIFTHDYFSSALHEIAHWCVAGEARRQLRDYGYWYEPDGRSSEQQAEFEIVEVKPQALEWLFSLACGVRFRVSADNLDAGLGPSEQFKVAIVQQAHVYCESGVNRRVKVLLQALIQYYATFTSVDALLQKQHFLLQNL